MKPDEKRIAIAEACGLISADGKWARSQSPFVGSWRTAVTEEEKVIGCHYGLIPDYLNDLNAMHEVENCIRGTPFFDKYIDFLREQFSISGSMTADADERADAFLITIGKLKP